MNILDLIDETNDLCLSLSYFVLIPKYNEFYTQEKLLEHLKPQKNSQDKEGWYNPEAFHNSNSL